MATYRSESGGSMASATSLVISNPSGLQIGDLLVAHIRANDLLVNTPTGWTLAQSTSPGNSLVGTLYKIASGPDVAAGSTTFTFAGSTTADGYLFAFANPNTTSPVNTSSSGFVTSGTVATAAAMTPTSTSKLLILMNQRGVGVGVVTSYSTTNNNPTWTPTHNAVIGNAEHAAAYGVYPFTTSTGTISANFTTTATVTAVATVHIIAITDASAIIPSALTMLFSTQNPTLPIVIKTAVTLTFSVLAPIVTNIVSKWQNTTKHTSTWINRTKS